MTTTNTTPKPTAAMITLFWTIDNELVAHGFAGTFEALKAEMVVLMDEMAPPLWTAEMASRVHNGTAAITQAVACEFGSKALPRPAQCARPETTPKHNPFPHHIARCRGCESCPKGFQDRRRR